MDVTPVTANERCWYAISSRSRHEKVIATALANTGVTTFLPCVREMRSWSDRRKLIDVPLFPGYVFVQIQNSAEDKLRVLKTSGVVQFVGTRKGAVPIQDKEISDVRAVLEQKIGCSPYPFLQLGQRVRVRGGSLDGVEGILLGRDSASKLVISIELIQRSLAISMYNFDVEPITSYHVRRGPAATRRKKRGRTGFNTRSQSSIKTGCPDKCNSPFAGNQS